MPVDSSWLRQGAVNVQQGSGDIVGIGTLWKGQITAGDLFFGPDGALYEVEAAAADTSLQLRTPYRGATAGNQPYAIVRNFTAQPWSDTASRLAEMVLLWRMTLKGFNDVLRSDALAVTLYDEAGAGYSVMSWKAVDKAVKDALAAADAAKQIATSKADKASTLAGYGIADAQPQSANLTALSKLDAVGLYASTGSGGATVRTLTAGQGVSVTNGDGKGGNPTVSLSPESAQAVKRVAGTIKLVYVPGDRDTFYPIGVVPTGTALYGGYVMKLRVFRPDMHAEEMGLGSYSADIWARISSWGHVAGEVFSVMQRQGNGHYNWGLGRVEPRGRTARLILWLRGGMTHMLQLEDVVADLDILMPGQDGKLLAAEDAQFGNEVWEPLKGDDKQPLFGALNVEVRPQAPLKFESLEKADQIFVPRPATDIAGANGYLIPGAYHVELGGDSALLADIQCDSGSTPRLQLIARYGNELWFRTARDRHENWDGVSFRQNRIWHSGNFDPGAPRMAAQFTRATLPAAGSMPGGIAYITDGPSGPTHVFSNGQKWRVPALTDL